MIFPASIIVRQSPDWDTLDSVDQLDPEQFDQKVGFITGTTRRSINLWNNSIAINYFSLRQQLKQLSISNYKSARRSICDTSNSRHRLSRFRLIYFVDDDDFLSPDWLDHLPSSNSKLVFCRWQSVRYSGSFDFRQNSADYSYTNNYVVYQRARSLFTFNQVYQHFDQSAVHNRLPDESKAYINLPLSLTHKHPASINTLRQSLQKSDWDPQIIKEEISHYLNRTFATPVPSSLHWFLPWRQKLTRIFEKLV